MPVAFLKLDLAEDAARCTRGPILVPASHRMVITSESSLTPDGYLERHKTPYPGRTKPSTYVTVEGSGAKYRVVQDFATVKAMLTGAGYKIIEAPAPEGTCVAQVALPENSRR
jgi:hypothetical protein